MDVAKTDLLVISSYFSHLGWTFLKLIPETHLQFIYTSELDIAHTYTLELLSKYFTRI